MASFNKKQLSFSKYEFYIVILNGQAIAADGRQPASAVKSGATITPVLSVMETRV